MKIISALPDLRTHLNPWRHAGQTIAFVPTMGNLHAGHISLVKAAQAVANHVVVSIFVNPLQFGPTEDYQSYPRTLEADCEKLKEVHTDLLFTPNVTDIYPQGMAVSTRVEVPQLGDILCGAARPGHFIGVATVVNKLFNIVQPDKALFGEKDYQQLQIIKRMVADLNMPIDIQSVPTCRESDGLAMSSRNGYLDATQRRQAPQLYQILNQLKTQIETGRRDFTEMETQAISQLIETGWKPDYVAVRTANLLTLPSLEDKHLVILAAARLGKTRLIDNIQLLG